MKSSGSAISRRRGEGRSRPGRISGLPRLLSVVLVLIVSVTFWHYYVLVSSYEKNPPFLRTEAKAPHVPGTTDDEDPDDGVGDDDVPDHQTPTVVAYAISLTGCGAGAGLTDGAAVLAHSIYSNSYPRLATSRYAAKMYALVHPDAKACSDELVRLGYDIRVVPTPVRVEDIQGQFLREHVANTGCCGEKEFIKLWAYDLLEHEIAVHLDLDYLVLRPLDDLYDVMVAGRDGKRLLRDKIRAGKIQVHDGPWSEKYFEEGAADGPVDAYFTRDYNMAHHGKKQAGVQGGFLVLRPSHSAFEEYVALITKGDFLPGKGWGGIGGAFYGAQQFQGVVPYFYDTFHPGTAVELNRCRYNTMADNPKDISGDTGAGKCRDSRDECEDCRHTDPEVVYTAHFTVCQKPWTCTTHSQPGIYHPLCKKLHARWFAARAEMEDLWAKEDADYSSARTGGGGDPDLNHMRGFCTSSRERGYVGIVLPQGKKAGVVR